jgi:hypothetical protein
VLQEEEDDDDLDILSFEDVLIEIEEKSACSCQ